MKKWTGGTVILALALLLSLRYALLPSSTPTSTASSVGPHHRHRRSHHGPSFPVPRLLPSLPGLDDLFPAPNSTHLQVGPACRLVWAHMRSLLARSDALPATADGVREASVAWKELLAHLDAGSEGKAAPLGVSDAELVNGSPKVAPLEVPDADELVDSSRKVASSEDPASELDADNEGKAAPPKALHAELVSTRGKMASLEWGKVLELVNKSGKVAPMRVSGSEPERRSCPFSASGNGSSLEIPCGFLEDSAVTIVGIPTGKNGSSSFGIDLVGARLPGGELDAPIVLRCNVRLGGDGPAVAQSSWTPETGWGEWDRCPAHGSAAGDRNIKVDGLLRCNEQLGQSVAPEKLNGSDQFGGEKPPVEQSKRSTHLSVNFPFAQGHPFTATVWAGLEGFHMTVNGRHETSFAYREKLEPWSVSEVRVAGDLELLSLLANGLPVSEDMEFVGDIEALKAPPVPKRRIFMLVGVSSTANNFERRMALRRSWMQYEAVRSGDVAVRFFTGLHKSKQVNMALWREAQKYGDIQLMPFVDYYSLITLKTIAACILGNKILPAKYIMKTDDDAFVRIDEVISSLKKSVSRGLLYGLISIDSSPQRDKDSKWFITKEEWPNDTYPPWAHGPGYIISRDMAKFVVQGHQERSLQLFKLEDVAMGIWIQEFKKTGQEVNYVNDDRFHIAGCESNYVLAHYQGPRLLLCLWEKLRIEHEAVCCE